MAVCIIEGSEISFHLEVPVEEIREKCQDIWDHSSKYSDYVDNSESSYYSFSKYLDVKFPNGEYVRLSDLVNEDEAVTAQRIQQNAAEQ